MTQKLRTEFPHWVLSDAGVHRVWAMRKVCPTTAQIKAGYKLYVDAGSPDELRQRLREEEARLSTVVAT